MNRLEWVSVNDRLPIMNEDVLVTDGKGSIQQYCYHGLHTVQSATDWGVDVDTPFWKRTYSPAVGIWIDPEDITHWLPISALVDSIPNGIDQTSGITMIQNGGSGNVQNIR